MKRLMITHFEAYVSLVMVLLFLYFYENDFAMISLVRATQTDRVDTFIGGELRD